jgi:hypothetical protein
MLRKAISTSSKTAHSKHIFSTTTHTSATTLTSQSPLVFQPKAPKAIPSKEEKRRGEKEKELGGVDGVSKADTHYFGSGVLVLPPISIIERMTGGMARRPSGNRVEGGRNSGRDGEAGGGGRDVGIGGGGGGGVDIGFDFDIL